MFCLDKGITFATEHEHLKLTSEWILHDKVVIDGHTLECKLTPNHKYAILQSFFASTHFSHEEKKALRTAALAGDNSDNAAKTSKICDYSLPDAELKEHLWRTITDTASSDSLAETKIKVQGFQQRKQQLDLMTPYFEKYYSIVSKIVETRDREFAEVFMSNLSPAFMAREQDAAIFNDLLKNADEVKHNFYCLFLKKQIESIDIIQKSRVLCETYKLD